MESVSVGLLAALAGGVGGELERQARAQLGALVRRPFQHADDDGQQRPATRPGEAESARLEEQPAKPVRAQALSAKLAMRAAVDTDFHARPQEWLAQAQLVRSRDRKTQNEISGGTVHGPVLQVRDASGALFTPQAPPSAAPGTDTGQQG